MKKIYVLLSTILLLIALFLLGDINLVSNSDEALAMNENEKTNSGEREIMMINRSKITNLKDIDPITNKIYAELLIEEISKYEASIENFKVADKYPLDYILTSINSYNQDEGTNSIYVQSARYVSTSTEKMFVLRVFLCKSAEAAQQEWLRFLMEGYASPILLPSEAHGIVIGDVSEGDEGFLYFIRGNIVVFIWSAGDNHIVEAAQAIDEEIIRALEDAALEQKKGKNNE